MGKPLNNPRKRGEFTRQQENNEMCLQITIMVGVKKTLRKKNCYNLTVQRPFLVSDRKHYYTSTFSHYILRQQNGGLYISNSIQAPTYLSYPVKHLALHCLKLLQEKIPELISANLQRS